MPRSQFRTVRIPETGALWKCPESALTVHGLDKHVVDDQVAGDALSSAPRPAKTSARRPKPQTQQTAEQPATTEEELQHGEDSR